MSWSTGRSTRWLSDENAVPKSSSEMRIDPRCAQLVEGRGDARDVEQQRGLRDRDDQAVRPYGGGRDAQAPEDVAGQQGVHGEVDRDLERRRGGVEPLRPGTSERSTRWSTVRWSSAAAGPADTVESRGEGCSSSPSSRTHPSGLQPWTASGPSRTGALPRPRLA